MVGGRESWLVKPNSGLERCWIRQVAGRGAGLGRLLDYRGAGLGRFHCG